MLALLALVVFITPLTVKNRQKKRRKKETEDLKKKFMYTYIKNRSHARLLLRRSRTEIIARCDDTRGDSCFRDHGVVEVKGFRQGARGTVQFAGYARARFSLLRYLISL